MSSSSFKHPIFLRTHRVLLPAIIAAQSNRFIAKFQRICGISENGTITNYPLYLFFKLASQVGEDVIILPFIVWFAVEAGPSFIAHLFIMLMSSQVLKDLLLLPRPPELFVDTATPFNDRREISITKLEGKFGTEYGFPSSHTVSGLLPMAYLVIIHNQGHVVGWNQIIASVVFVVCVAASRLYVGVHSPADLCGGAVLGVLLLALSSYYKFVDVFVMLTMTNVWSLFVCANIVVFFLYCYPRADPWRASFGTAALILGFWLGGALSFIYLKWYYAMNLSDGVHNAAATDMWWNSRSIASVLRHSSLIPILSAGDSHRTGTVQSMQTIVLKSIVGIAVTISCFLVGKSFFGWLFMRLRALRGSFYEPLIDVNGLAVTPNKLYSVEVPTRYYRYCLYLYRCYDM